MPQWTPKITKLQQQIDEAKTRAEVEYQQNWARFRNLQPSWQPPVEQNIPQPQLNLPQAEQRQWSPAVNVAQEPTMMSQNVMTRIPERGTMIPDLGTSPIAEPIPDTTQKPAWYEAPKRWWTGTEEKIGEAISKAPILPEVLQKVAPAFEWIHENLEKPFAAIITSPFRPSLPWKQGESWLEHQKREYDAWEAPTYVKGAAEFAMPLWWMPWFGWAGKGARALGVGGKVSTQLAKGGKALQVAGKLPADELLDKVLFKSNLTGRIGRAMEHVPVINKIVEKVGGIGIFADPIAKDPLNITRRALVKMGFVSDMRNGIKSLHVPKLQVMGKIDDVLGMDSKGAISKIVDKSGKSQYLYDVLEGALKDPDNYKFLTKEAKQYVETLSEILDDVYKMAAQEGVRKSKTITLHRIVKGKTSPKTGKYEASDYGSLFEVARHHPLMKGGVEAGVDYGLDINESIASTIDHYVRAISRKRFENEVGKLGKTAKEMFIDAFPDEAKSITELGKTIVSSKYAGQALSRLSSYGGGRLPPSVLSKIKRELPEVAVKIERALLLSPEETTAIISKLSNELKATLKLSPIEVNATVKQIEYIARAFRNESSIGKIMSGDIDDAIRYVTGKVGEQADIVEKVYKEAYTLKRKAVREAITAVKEDAKRIMDSAKETLKPLRSNRNQFLKHYEGKQILGENLAKFARHPVFGDSIFPKEVVKTTEKLLMDDSQKWLQTAASISGLSRMTVAAMDFSAPFIQGAALWGRNPLAWTRGVKNMFEFFVKPDNLYKYMVDPKISMVRTERILHGGSSSTFEFFRALQPLQKQVGKVPVVGKGIKAAIGATYGRAEAAFTGFGEVARNELWKALRRPNMTEDMLMDLSRSIDRMTGVMSTEALAIGRTQQDFENAFVFFAPRYTRAGLSFVGDAFQGGMAGAEARKALGSLMASGVAFYYGACKALDQQPNFNPSSGRFMTIKVGDSHIGVGGIMTALLRLGYDVGVTAVEDPINLVKPLTQGKLNRWDNPFIKFLYSRTAPITSTIGQAIEGTNYFGEPIEGIDEWAKFLADKITPIAVQSVMKDPQVETALAEFGGLRVFPKSPWELLDEERNQKSVEQYGVPYEQLNDLQQTRVDKSSTIIDLQKQVDAQTVTRGDAVSVGFLNRERERNEARQVYEETLWNLQRAYDDGTIDGVQFREEMSNAGYGLGTTYEHIDRQSEYKEVLKTLQQPRKIKDKHLEDIAYSEFMDKLYRNDEFEDKYGLFQFDKYNQFINEFRAKYGEEIYGYILEKKRERDANLPSLAKEYQQAKEIMKPYWEVQSEVERMFGKMFAESNAGQRLISKLRKNIRLTNPSIEVAYQKFYAKQGI